MRFPYRGDNIDKVIDSVQSVIRETVASEEIRQIVPITQTELDALGVDTASATVQIGADGKLYLVRLQNESTFAWSTEFSVAFLGASVGFSAERVHNALSRDDLSTYNFTSASLGVAAVGREIVVAVMAAGPASSAVSSVSIAGNAATKIVGAATVSGRVCDLWQATVASGTSGTISVVFNDTMDGCRIVAYRLTGLNPVAHDTLSDVETSVAGTPGNQTFTASGTFTVPDYDTLTVVCKGSGGGGGGGGGGSGSTAQGDAGEDGGDGGDVYFASEGQPVGVRVSAEGGLRGQGGDPGETTGANGSNGSGGADGSGSGGSVVVGGGANGGTGGGGDAGGSGGGDGGNGGAGGDGGQVTRVFAAGELTIGADISVQVGDAGGGGNRGAGLTPNTGENGGAGTKGSVAITWTTSSNPTTTVGGTIDIPEGGVLIAASVREGGSGAGFASVEWVGVTQDVAPSLIENFGGGYIADCSTALSKDLAQETGRTATAEWTADDVIDEMTFAAASFALA